LVCILERIIEKQGTPHHPLLPDANRGGAFPIPTHFTTWRFPMTDDESSKNTGTVLLTFLAGALLGAGIAFLAASRKGESDSEGYDEADLFV
jgi:hypothetical protein